MQENAARPDPLEERGTPDGRQDYVPLMLQAMSERNIGLRQLALRAGIGKSRLGLILHHNTEKRARMTLAEFQRLLLALEIDPIEAVVSVEIATDGGGIARHKLLIGMLCAMFRSLPARLIAELEEVEGVDGTEVRAEWAPVLQRAVIKRLVHEIGAVARRRTELSDFSMFG